MDLRRTGSEYEKKYIELTNEDIEKISLIFRNWRNKDKNNLYKDIPEFCKV